nr:phage protease [Kineococcus vitellinus]
MHVDPPQLIISDERDASLNRVTYSISGDEVTFSDPVKVRIVYEDVDSGAVAAAEATTVVVYSTKEESRGANNVNRSNDPVHLSEEKQVNPEHLKALGLEEGATDEQITEALNALAAAKDATASNTDPAPEDTPAPTSAPGSAPVTIPQQKDGDVEAPQTVTVDAAALAELQAEVSRGRQLREKIEAGEKDALIAAAMNEGKFGPSVSAGWRKALDDNYEITKATIASLPKTINLSESGHGGTGEEDIAASAEQYSTLGLTPGEIARINRFKTAQEA